MTARPEVLDRALELTLRAVAATPGRVLIGICGPPAAGKSTLAVALADTLTVQRGLSSVVVPMDGFHLSNSELERLGLAGRKGAPQTFDAAGFMHLLRRVRTGDELVYAPAYSRTLHESIGGVIAVAPDVRVVVVEGNYLLLRCKPWHQVRPLLDLALYLEAPAATRFAALLERQLAKGLDDGAARAWVSGSDERNAELIATSRGRGDAVLRRGGP